MLTVSEAHSQREWDAFLLRQPFTPFLQSWTMGEVHRNLGQEPVRLELREGGELRGICQGVIVPAKRGRHLAVPYGPVTDHECRSTSCGLFAGELSRTAKAAGCSFIRWSPFLSAEAPRTDWPLPNARPSPLHLLAEHLWYLPLRETNRWKGEGTSGTPQTEEDLLRRMRQTTRNLIRRAEKEGVEVRASEDPLRDLPHFLTLHAETRSRHRFTPYTDAFFNAQVRCFAPRGELTLTLARYRDEPVAASIHMHLGGETSYHHGASTLKYKNLPASIALQWRAIRDALARGDAIYNFWGIAPPHAKRHPFSGVTLFKTGFGGELLELVHCHDLPLSPSYALTRSFELLRKWHRGF